MAANLPPEFEPAIETGGALRGPWRAVFVDWWRRLGQGGDLTFTVQSDTEVIVQLRGSDGVTRSTTLTLT